MAAPTTKTYDAVLCFSVVFLFNEEDLRRFFRHVRACLTKGGHLILDVPGAPNNLLTRFVDSVLLKFEARVPILVKLLRHRTARALITKHFGYRRTDKEVLEAAASCGFSLVSQENYDYLTEFERSIILRKLMVAVPLVRRLLELIGRKVPYTRMYDLQML